MERISNNQLWFVFANSHCLNTVVATAFSSQYYRAILSNIQGESDMNFRPPMAMRRGALGSNMTASGWREFSILPLIFVCKLTLSENCCFHGLLLQILQRHPVQHQWWVWYEFQAANGNGRGRRIRHQGSLILNHPFSCWNYVLLYCLLLLQFYWTMSSKGNKHSARLLTAKSPAYNKKTKNSVFSGSNIWERCISLLKSEENP